MNLHIGVKVAIKKKELQKNLLDDIFRISNKEYQKRIWIDELGPECYSFDDTVCDFFDDCGLVLENHIEYGLGDHQYEVLKKFYDEFDIFVEDNHWPPLFIDTPEWALIMEKAKEVFRAFDYKSEKTN